MTGRIPNTSGVLFEELTCVMRSRHRADMSVVIDDASAEVFAHTEPSTAHAADTGLLAALHRTPAVATSKEK
ncbi:hypothetical protein ACFWAY_50800 [Rhodococcus sp. NPDC059968]|uniref:hypothetical protein n=1 Tax=Rhodococcus sp. NPDC059968 TaxID=3347017 RepID=UPI00366E4259